MSRVEIFSRFFSFVLHGLHKFCQDSFYVNGIQLIVSWHQLSSVDPVTLCFPSHCMCVHRESHSQVTFALKEFRIFLNKLKASQNVVET